MLKDKAINYNNFSEINVKCFSCKSNNHLITHCPLLHFIPNKEKIIFKLNCKAIRNKNFKRSEKKNINSLSNTTVFKSSSHIKNIIKENLFFSGKTKSFYDEEKIFKSESDEDFKENYENQGFDEIKNFEVYFPHNNFKAISEKMEKIREKNLRRIKNYNEIKNRFSLYFKNNSENDEIYE